VGYASTYPDWKPTTTDCVSTLPNVTISVSIVTKNELIFIPQSPFYNNQISDRIKALQQFEEPANTSQSRILYDLNIIEQ
jgi:hypothetical protein